MGDMPSCAIRSLGPSPIRCRATDPILTVRSAAASSSSPAVHRMGSREERVRRLYRLQDHSSSDDGPLVGLAPMVRAGTTPLRTLALQYGADLVYTEELMDRSILSTQRVVHVPDPSSAAPDTTIDYVKNVSQMTRKTMRKMGDHAPLLLRIDPARERQRLVVQLGTGSPELAREAATHVALDADAVDINMGCPKRFSTGGGMGSALLNDPERACRIVRAVADAVGNIPVSAKIRLLPSTHATVDFCQGLIHAGCSAIAIHARHVGDAETQPAKWDQLREALAILTTKHTNVPFLVNGDFYTRQEFTEFCSDTGARGVLLGRPALYNTSIFRAPAEDIPTQPSHYSYDSPLLLDKTTVIQEYLRHAVRYHTHYKNVKYVISEMMSFRRTPSHRVPFLPHVYPDGQTIGRTCDCHSLAALCHLWNVNDTPAHRPGEGDPARPETVGAPHSGDDRTYSEEYIRNRLEDPTLGPADGAMPTKRTKRETLHSA